MPANRPERDRAVQHCPGHETHPLLWLATGERLLVRCAYELPEKHFNVRFVVRHHECEIVHEGPRSDAMLLRHRRFRIIDFGLEAKGDKAVTAQPKQLTMEQRRP
jgi:hypothetical protein